MPTTRLRAAKKKRAENRVFGSGGENWRDQVCVNDAFITLTRPHLSLLLISVAANAGRACAHAACLVPTPPTYRRRAVDVPLTLYMLHPWQMVCRALPFAGRGKGSVRGQGADRGAGSAALAALRDAAGRTRCALSPAFDRLPSAVRACHAAAR